MVTKYGLALDAHEWPSCPRTIIIQPQGKPWGWQDGLLGKSICHYADNLSLICEPSSTNTLTYVFVSMSVCEYTHSQIQFFKMNKSLIYNKISETIMLDKYGRHSVKHAMLILLYKSYEIFTRSRWVMIRNWDERKVRERE